MNTDDLIMNSVEDELDLLLSILESIIYHDERGQGVLYERAMRDAEMVLKHHGRLDQ